jgi:hypothetical protein
VLIAKTRQCHRTLYCSYIISDKLVTDHCFTRPTLSLSLYSLGVVGSRLQGIGFGAITQRQQKTCYLVTKYKYMKSTTLYVPSSELGLSAHSPAGWDWGSPNSDDWKKAEHSAYSVSLVILLNNKHTQGTEKRGGLAELYLCLSFFICGIRFVKFIQ